jgi:hypothetical protein
MIGRPQVEAGGDWKEAEHWTPTANNSARDVASNVRTLPQDVPDDVMRCIFWHSKYDVIQWLRRCRFTCSRNLSWSNQGNR